MREDDRSPTVLVIAAICAVAVSAVLAAQTVVYPDERCDRQTIKCMPTTVGLCGACARMAGGKCQSSACDDVACPCDWSIAWECIYEPGDECTVGPATGVWNQVCDRKCFLVAGGNDCDCQCFTNGPGLETWTQNELCF